MRLVRYRTGGDERVGVVQGEIVIDVGRCTGGLEAFLGDSHLQALAQRLAADETVARDGAPLSEVELLPLGGRASKVIGVGMNYRSFVSQLGSPAPLHPTLFHKTSAALNAAGNPILVPPETLEAVPEGELAVLISRTTYRVAPAAARKHIAGYTCANDISARNLEFQTSQWTAGKMLPTFCPLGPALVSVDEAGDISRRILRTYVNGAIVQIGNTSDMIFGIDELVSRVSYLVALEAGDVLLTGTPSDLGAVDPPVFLRHGDVVRVEIDDIGVLENPVVHGG
jgi:2-keto-4-pentenoate hydratase/2-oxohepta-3-ene-1,7-dioic acid hydratase in catechol pathway